MAARKKTTDTDDTTEEVEEVEEVDYARPESLEPGSTFASRAKARNKRVGAGNATSKG